MPNHYGVSWRYRVKRNSAKRGCNYTPTDSFEPGDSVRCSTGTTDRRIRLSWRKCLKCPVSWQSMERPNPVKLNLPRNMVLSSLPVPDNSSRRNPLALPFPCNLVHIMEIRSGALGEINRPNHKINSPFLRFDFKNAGIRGSWSMTLRLCILADSVPPDMISVYHRTVREIQDQFNWYILPAIGHRQPQRRSDFGQLPPPLEPVGASVCWRDRGYPKPLSRCRERPVSLIIFYRKKVSPRAASAARERHSEQRSRRRHHGGRHRGRRWPWLTIIRLAVAVAVVIVGLTRCSGTH